MFTILHILLAKQFKRFYILVNCEYLLLNRYLSCNRKTVDTTVY